MAPVGVSDRIVTVFGGSGFVGRHVIRALAAQGWRVRNACRRPDLAFHLQPLGSVGQIVSVQANVRNTPSVEAAVEGADAVINLVAIAYESGRQTFHDVHVGGAARVAEAAKAAGVKTLVQMSALGISAESKSVYARTKVEGEAAVLKAFPDAVILRPSVIFGPEDRFLNRFAALARLSPVLPLIGGGATKFQPIFVGDVADAVAAVLGGRAKAGGTYELGGPDVQSFREIMEYILEVTGRKRLLVPLPFPIAALQAQFLQLLPKPLLTADQVELLKGDSVVSQTAAKNGFVLENLGVRSTAMDTVVPSYLYRFRKAGQFTDMHAT
ncbi:3-beta-hydroxy-Delta(5)-steroid dehydrogenase [Terrihabitans soli]|uniref:3-beta-hydroxy-Delta(5)-steroid dehydrogenase n=1 Tax=Terrihabitans soli TaxID=708113 RepID=A0A6S6QZI4_9HYPH|nr:complex I NDUFA9 subunit family protein [Terrihabitans soli]BCJ92068.1 3-beta-hydroxy-Delta(5)-steroid dehydrogenase [Terrihabitans soli]